MRSIGACACAYVAFDLAGKATGSIPQDLFAKDHLWVWWIFAVLWGASAIKFLFRNGDSA
jgi:hypothetical protein